MVKRSSTRWHLKAPLVNIPVACSAVYFTGWPWGSTLASCSGLLSPVWWFFRLPLSVRLHTYGMTGGGSPAWHCLQSRLRFGQMLWLSSGRRWMRHYQRHLIRHVRSGGTVNPAPPILYPRTVFPVMVHDSRVPHSRSFGIPLCIPYYPLDTIYIYILAEAARIRRASTAMVPSKKTKYTRWYSYDGASTLPLCEPCTEVRILSP